MADMKRSTTKRTAVSKTAVTRAAGRKGSAAKTVTSATTREVPRTAGGTRLTRAYEKQLTAEAEVGFDVDGLLPRRVGRPSLTGRPGKSRRLALRVDDDTFVAVRALAVKEQRAVSDLVRDALRRYVDAR